MSTSLIAPVVDHRPAPFREPSAIGVEGGAADRAASPPHRSAAAAMIRGLGGRTESALRRELDRFFASRPESNQSDRRFM